jgi:ATP-dependent HslUV protease ATP-binding subunit HslU
VLPEAERLSKARNIVLACVRTRSLPTEQASRIRDLVRVLNGLLPPHLRDKAVERAASLERPVSLGDPEEAEKLIDHDEVHREALWRAENSGIVFLDELDKIASSGHSSGPDVSGEGVQRDLLPIVEGTSVSTRWGQVNTDHVLFIAAGAFSVAKPSDLIPELQGRFPVRVELEDLNANDLRRILTQPEHALTKQYQALLAVDGTELQFSDDGLEAIAQAAERVNREIEDIGARRLHTILETVLEDVAFGTNLGRVQVDAAYVERKIGALIEDEDLSRYVL